MVLRCELEESSLSFWEAAGLFQAHSLVSGPGVEFDLHYPSPTPGTASLCRARPAPWNPVGGGPGLAALRGSLTLCRWPQLLWTWTSDKPRCVPWSTGRVHPHPPLQTVPVEQSTGWGEESCRNYIPHFPTAPHQRVQLPEVHSQAMPRASRKKRIRKWGQQTGVTPRSWKSQRVRAVSWYRLTLSLKGSWGWGVREDFPYKS